VVTTKTIQQIVVTEAWIPIPSDCVCFLTTSTRGGSTLAVSDSAGSAVVDFDCQNVDGGPAELQGRPVNFDMVIRELTFFMLYVVLFWKFFVMQQRLF
jgi:hypothetical protein